MAGVGGEQPAGDLLRFGILIDKGGIHPAHSERRRSAVVGIDEQAGVTGRFAAVCTISSPVSCGMPGKNSYLRLNFCSQATDHFDVHQRRTDDRIVGALGRGQHALMVQADRTLAAIGDLDPAALPSAYLTWNHNSVGGPGSGE